MHHHLRLFIGLFFLLVTPFSSARTVDRGRCSAPDAEPWVLEQASRFARQISAQPQLAYAISAQAISIPTWFHVIQSGSSYSQGNIPQDYLTRQLSALNEHYRPTGISFTLAGTTRTTNSNWFAGRDEAGMKKALHKGTYATLNVYYVQLSGGSLGYCYFPKANPSANDKIMDGCVVRFDTTPGGSLQNYNQGKTVTHEVGHFLGLYHTFQGGCYGSGDGISDTPAQRSGTRGCPSTQPDTCPFTSGKDPIHNYMDYSFDSCMTEFTPNQITRMNQWYSQYRAGK